MLTPYRPHYIERVMTDSLGCRYRVIFAVSYIGEEVRGRVISATLIQSLNGQTAKSAAPLCLSSAVPLHTSKILYLKSCVPVVSPYFSLEYLLNSQPTRAPSRR